MGSFGHSDYLPFSRKFAVIVLKLFLVEVDFKHFIILNYFCQFSTNINIKQRFIRLDEMFANERKLHR